MTSGDGRPFARLAVYAGSFDPPTLGHLDLIERASALFSDVVKSFMLIQSGTTSARRRKSLQS